MKLWLRLYRNMYEDDRVRLGHMLQSANEVLSFAEGRFRVDLDHDRMLLRRSDIAGVQAAGIRSAMGPDIVWYTTRDVGRRNRLPRTWTGESACPTLALRGSDGLRVRFVPVAGIQV